MENFKWNQSISIVDFEAHHILNKNNQCGFDNNFQSGINDKFE